MPRETQQPDRSQCLVVPHALLPLVRVVQDMFVHLGYTPINPAFLDLLCDDLELLAVMQRLAFRLMSEEVQACQK